MAEQASLEMRGSKSCKVRKKEKNMNNSTTKQKTTYMPPMEEILEDVTFDLDSTTSDEDKEE